MNELAAARIFDAAEVTAGWVGTERFAALANSALTLVAGRMTERMRDDDDPGLFVPVEIENGGESCTGAVLTLQDRVVLAWIHGRFRITTCDAVIRYSAIREVRTSSRPGSAFAADRPVLHLRAETEWSIVFANVFEGGRPIVSMLADVLSGSAKVSSHEQPASEVGAPRSAPPPRRPGAGRHGPLPARAIEVDAAKVHDPVGGRCPRCEVTDGGVDPYCDECGLRLRPGRPGLAAAMGRRGAAWASANPERAAAWAASISPPVSSVTQPSDARATSDEAAKVHEPVGGRCPRCEVTDGEVDPYCDECGLRLRPGRPGLAHAMKRREAAWASANPQREAAWAGRVASDEP